MSTLVTTYTDYYQRNLCFSTNVQRNAMGTSML